MKKTDHELLHLFHRSPNDAMEQLIQQYTALVWSVCSNHLNNAEDIKECVNETFSEFYRRIDSFDEEKGTISSYLSAIAKNRAISKYQKNKYHNQNEPLEEHIFASSSDDMDQAEWKMVLKEALGILSADERRIVELKYYENMTVKEIADAMGIPYETVKKRHQRSLSKLKKALIGLLIFVLISVLAACAYMVLRYFGVVPGYGINVSEEVAAYVLEEPVSSQFEDTQVTITDAFFMNGIGKVELTIVTEALDNQLTSTTDQLCIDGIDYSAYLQTSSQLDENTQLLTYDYSGLPAPDKTREKLDAVFHYGDLQLPFTLRKASEKQTTDFSTAFVNERGLLAIPKTEHETLIVEIHPLNQEPITILPSLVRCIYDSFDPNMAPVTLSDQNGNIIEGQCIGYNPMSSSLFFDWSFGVVKPGNYTLHVPYVYETIEIPEDFSMVLDLKHGIDTDTVYKIPGGSIKAVSCTPIDPEKIPPSGQTQIIALPDTDYWVATFSYSSDRENFHIIGFHLSAEAAVSGAEKPNGIGIGVVDSPEENQISYLISLEQGDYQVDSFTLTPNDSMMGSSMYRRWNQSFDLPITVEEGNASSTH